jgi:hypothetical protein
MERPRENMIQQLKYMATAFCASCLILTACNNSNSPHNKNENLTMTKQHQDSIKQFIHDYVEEIWNKRDFSKADKYWGADLKKMFLHHSLTMDLKE